MNNFPAHRDREYRIGFSEVRVHESSKLETLSPVRSHRCSPNTRNRSRSSIASRLACTGCSATAVGLCVRDRTRAVFAETGFLQLARFRDRAAPGISGPPVASGRTTLADCDCASPRSQVAAAAARIDGSTGSGFQPNRARCGVRRDSGLQSLQSGGSASVAVRLPNDNRQSVDQQLRIPSFGTRSVQLSERKSGRLLPKRHQIKHLEFVVSWFGTRGSEVQILSPRPIPSAQSDG